MAAPVVLAGHAYAGAVIAATGSDKVKALVYVSALSPDEGETVADVFYRGQPHPQAPKLAPEGHGLDLYAGSSVRRRFRAKCLANRSGPAPAAVQRPISPACITVAVAAAPLEGPANFVPGAGAGPHDRYRETSASWPSA